MTSAKVAQFTASPRLATPPPPPPTAEAEHLLQIVEKQPSCLLRVGLDGLILAANDAGLGLLGAQQPAQVLGGFLTTWIMPAYQDAWREFARAVAGGVPQSMECEVTDVSGTQRCVAFHGVPLVDHADGIPSVILGARDTTAQRRLEAALCESEAIRQSLSEGQHHPTMEGTTRQVQELEAKIKETEQALSKLPQLELLLKQGRTHLQDLRNKLVEATKERDELIARLGEREAENERLWSEQVQLQQSLSGHQQRELDELRVGVQEAQTARNEAEARLVEREAEQEALRGEQVRLRAALDEAVAERAGLATQLEAHRAELERSLTEKEERHRLETDEHLRVLDTLRVEHSQAFDALRVEMEQAATDRNHLTSQLTAIEDAHLRQVADLRAEYDELVQVSDTYRQQMVRDHEVARSGFEKAVADHRVELQSMDLATRNLEPLAVAGRLALAVARELLTAVADIDARAACLVAECPVESSSREEIEQLRADAVRASSLARQILHASELHHSQERT